MLTFASGIEVPARFGRALEAIAAIAVGTLASSTARLCTYLSAVLLVGLVLGATLGWSWADPMAALVIVAIAVKEGRDAWQGKGCCAPTSAVIPGSTGTGTGACGCRSGCDCCN
ncbi:cation diffusion facilitator family transporter [Streptomyces mirabilis]|uniref:hypothetical protein n=1 Tax=Streptomyces mirabilis TaxID=68239 RepID=UPI0036D1AB5B